MSNKLIDVIKKVRGAKTAAEERVVIKNECIMIRTAFKEGKEQYRSRNVNKLMYLSLLGHPTEFGQVECIKLISSDIFREKKIGYLALTMLLDETDDILTLVEHQLKVDLSNKNEHVRAMVLTTIANISGEDMARGLSSEVAACCAEVGNGNIRKRACLAALRCVRRVPTLVETFLNPVADVFHEKVSSGVLLSALPLINECLLLPEAESYKHVFTSCLPQAILKLKTIATGSITVDRDFSGISDPFLQTKLLQFFRIVGSNDDSTQQLIEILIKVSTFTDGSTLPGNAVLYECVKTILALDEEELIPFAVTILGRFLTNKSNNMRYVALETFPMLIEKDHAAVMRHKNTIVDCLTDYDDSIRRRALDLVYSLVDNSNVRALIPDLLGYLEFSKKEFKDDLAAKICTACERYAPSVQWHIGTLLNLMCAAGEHLNESAANKFIRLVSQSEKNIQEDMVGKLWAKVPATPDSETIRKEALLQATVWCAGEYADYLVPSVSAESVLSKIKNILQTSNSTTVKQYCLNSLFKAAVKFPAQQKTAVEVFQFHQSSSNTELQQRAWEYLQMLVSSDTSIARAAAERMPVTEENSIILTSSTGAGQAAPQAEPQAEPQVSAHADPVTGNGDAGFLDSIFGGSDATPAAAAAPASNGVLIDDIFGSAPAAPPSAAPKAPLYTPPHPVIYQTVGLQNADVTVTFYVMKQDPSRADVLITAVIANLGSTQLTNVEMLAAVTKTAVLQMHPKEQMQVPPHGLLVQPMSVTNQAEPRPVAMKLRLTYTSAAPVKEEFTVSGLMTVRT
eukprot:TRINITY_DN1513_c0_g1_i1.p1 TRINITY_DN1513_c0_g1~~TRINITY_DN1513_c0_g1_i1.p1  ORF type:complete len:823 (+),score=184.47 TRINITY_DN1513_c0_g1_i1:83-2470(+)